jgi:hypothetical protein
VCDTEFCEKRDATILIHHSCSPRLSGVPWSPGIAFFLIPENFQNGEGERPLVAGNDALRRNIYSHLLWRTQSYFFGYLESKYDLGRQVECSAKLRTLESIAHFGRALSQIAQSNPTVARSDP